MTEIRTDSYRLSLSRDGTLAELAAPDGTHWASLRLLAALDTVEGPDETLSVEPARADARTIVVERRSTRWEAARTTLRCTDDALEVRTSVRGRGALTDVRLLAGRSVAPGLPTGLLPSGSSFRTLFSPNPGDPGRLVRPAAEGAVVGVSGDGNPGRGHWFFTPAPLCLCLTTASVPEPLPLDEGWLALAVAAPLEELRFVQLAYEAGDGAFALRLDYEGHTHVDGDFEAPPLVLSPGHADPYTALREHREDLVARGAAPPVLRRARPAWWSGPIFCGWGAQCHLASTTGGRASDFATQEHYDEFLSELELQGVLPSTIVLDDKWQDGYGTNAPDPAKWPDLRGWIAARHARGQRVLLWWKAWDAEGLPPELCIRNADGAPVALDPANPAARAALREIVDGLLGPAGLDADGLKVDFTARTPSGTSLVAHGGGWGIQLLHELLATVHDAAKAARRDALLITHTPHPAFVDVTDMIRLNDMVRTEDAGPLPDVVAQMRYRAAVVAAACPELLVDTDDWCAPSRSAWRAYLAAKLDLGVPSLYYATHLDSTGEALEAEDYRALREAWAGRRAS